MQVQAGRLRETTDTVESQSEVKARGTQGWPSYSGRRREARAELHPLERAALTPRRVFLTNGGSAHERRGKVVALRSCDMAEVEVLAERWRSRADRWMTLLVMDVQQLFTAATLVT